MPRKSLLLSHAHAAHLSCATEARSSCVQPFLCGLDLLASQIGSLSLGQSPPHGPRPPWAKGPHGPSPLWAKPPMGQSPPWAQGPHGPGLPWAKAPHGPKPPMGPRPPWAKPPMGQSPPWAKLTLKLVWFCCAVVPTGELQEHLLLRKAMSMPSLQVTFFALVFFALLCTCTSLQLHFFAIDLLCTCPSLHLSFFALVLLCTCVTGMS